MRKMIIEIINQDMTTAIEALKRDEFDFINIIGNRITVNLMVGNRNDLMMVGFFLKEVSGELEEIRRSNERNLLKCKEKGRKFLEDLQSLLKMDQIDKREIWKKYGNYEGDIRKYLLNDIEASIYKESQNFTKETRLMLLQHLKQNKELLLKEGNDLITGIIREIARVINTHGFYREDLVFYILMKVFGSYYDYFLYDYLKKDENNKKEKENEINSYVEKIYKLFSEKNDLDVIYERSADMIGELGCKWRKYFINYGEIRLPPSERKISLPPRVKEELGKAIAEGLQKKVKKR
jgi:hypothetical protein